MARTVVAITGASSGIGEVFARKLAPEHDLLLIARRKDRLDQLSGELSSKYACRVETLQADLTAESGLAAAAERIANEPRLTLLVNNAGFGARGLFWESSLDVQEGMQRLHVLATVRLTHSALRNLVPRNVGGVINVSSVSAWVRRPGSSGYAASKSWINAFTEGVYLELRSVQSEVAVQALCPGFTYSEFHDKVPLDRKTLASSSFWLTAEQVVDASLDGLRRRQLFVVPGWRYRLFTAVFAKIPTTWRLAIERETGRRGQAASVRSAERTKQLQNSEDEGKD